MSDQVSGPVGWMLIITATLAITLPNAMTMLSGDSVVWTDWAGPIVFCTPIFIWGMYLITTPYSWWPTHAEDRVRRIRELVDEKECDSQNRVKCENNPGGKT